MNAAVFLLSAAILLHEVLLLRVLSLAWWHHAAALVVSVALLGFGAAGTLLALAPRLRDARVVPGCAALFALSIPLVLDGARAVDFNVLEVGWQKSQWLRLLAVEAVFTVPFLAGALGISVALARGARRPGGIYAANLLGSGTGALLAPLLLERMAPAAALHVAALLAAAAALAGARGAGRLAGPVAAAAVLLLGIEPLAMSPFKDLPATPLKTVLETREGPRGRVARVASPALHVAPGLALNAPRFPEDQEGLFVDGHLVAARDTRAPDYLDHTLGALPFVAGCPRSVLLLGVGPDLARPGDLVEADAHLLAASGRAGVVAEARRFLADTDRHWDLVVHHVPELHAASETPLLTVAGLRAMWARTAEGGGVALGCALSMPPRAGLKLLATARAVTGNLVAARSADRLCVWMLKTPPDADLRARVRSFCDGHGFDLVLPEAWRGEEPFHETPVPLVDPGPDYPYDLRPATDARPYFFKFFRWSRPGDLFDPEQTSFVQWPFVALVVAFLEVLALGLLLLVGPLVASRAARAPAALFLALGAGFMLLEMAYLQQAMVRLGSPVHAAAAVIGGFLFGAGAGSLAGERLGRPLRRAALAAALLAPAGWMLLPAHPVPAALVCALVAFPMGIPFPAALARLPARSTAWALAWNGCASVAAAAAAPLLSSTVSIPATLGAAAALYLLVAARGGRH